MMVWDNLTFTVYRLATTDGDKVAISAVATLSDLTGYLEPASPEIAVMYDDVSGSHTYNLTVCSVNDIRIGDRLTSTDGDDYYVKAFSSYSGNTDVDNHVEYIVLKEYTE